MAKNSCQKKPHFSEILGTKVVQFWCYTKLVKTKNMPLNWYFSTRKIFRKIRVIFDIENWLWKSDFGSYFWPFNKSHERINAIFVIHTIMALIWNGFYQIPLTWWKTYDVVYLNKNYTRTEQHASLKSNLNNQIKANSEKNKQVHCIRTFKFSSLKSI